MLIKGLKKNKRKKKIISRMPIYKTPSDKWMIPLKLDSRKQRRKVKKELRQEKS